MVSRSVFYQTHLDRVSRSFAFCIPKLEAPFREWVGLSYLLCRIVDTVEDSPWATPEEQRRHFDLCERLLLAPVSIQDQKSFENGLPASIPSEERLLIQDSASIFADLHSLPPRVKQAIQDPARRMLQGMLKFSEQKQDGALSLNGLIDVNRYCYFVAGTVGELLTRLFLNHKRDFEAPHDLHRMGCQFGIFLQKVNLLKDQRRDETEKRFLVPDRQQVFASLMTDSAGAIGYLLAIPKNDRGYRLFCAWSLFLGLASLPWIEESYLGRTEAKIPRHISHKLYAEIVSLIDDNRALEDLFNEQLEWVPGIKKPLEPNQNSSLLKESVFQNLALGVLGPQDLIDIGLAV